MTDDKKPSRYRKLMAQSLFNSSIENVYVEKLMKSADLMSVKDKVASELLNAIHRLTYSERKGIKFKLRPSLYYAALMSYVSDVSINELLGTEKIFESLGITKFKDYKLTSDINEINKCTDQITKNEQEVKNV